ncbi:hypothetical protein SAMN05444166_4103 [Singulisphaera sp. GP187]|uniref:hypothetical protein n=1 Tax=Singulisphaera sp. GP187 TaxID=1882752 RepID=UPI00092A3CE9|nr:hypothetical protein [Singulisphaera sp. GP187]SIO36254.1 hypothetical protein SAMN05444166_4103 [Singulisphaera sp. GP187]
MGTTSRIGRSPSVLGLLGIGLLASLLPSGGEAPGGKLTLTLSRQPTKDEAIVLRLAVGVLPRNARVIVRTVDGKIAGTVAPFGVRPLQKAGVYQIAVPAKAVVGDKVTLRLEVLEKGAGEARLPTREEIEDAKLTFVPVTPKPKKSKQ